MFAQKLGKHYAKKFVEPVIKGYLDMDWVEYLKKLRKEVGVQTWAVKKGVVVFVDGVFVGGEEELFRRFRYYVFEQPSSEKIKSLATEEYLGYMKRSNLLYTFLELSLDGQYMGSLLFELRPDLLPKTCVWFATVCDPHNQLGYSYKNSKISRVCKRGWFQAGKLGLGTSAGFMEDESFCYKHDRRGILSMANYGKDSNRAQFFVTFEPCQWMDEYYVAFGRLVEGSQVLNRLECTKCTYESPDHEIKVENCGMVGVGFARNLVVANKHKLKGITVGEPHIDLSTFMDMVMQRFDHLLFERLDAEVKRQLHAKWMEHLLWNAIKPQLMTREPIQDVCDINDRSSKDFDPAVYLKGLYGLKEIPDKIITEVLGEIIDNAVDVVDTREMAGSIVNLIVNNLDLEVRSRDVKGSASDLAADVNSIVYGQDELNASRKALFQRSVHKVASQTPTIRKLLTEYSTYSLSQASVLVGDEGMVNVSSRRSIASSVASSLPPSSVRKSPRRSVTTASTFAAPTATRISVTSFASHGSTIRKLMTDYERFSETTGPRVSVPGDEPAKLSSRKSVVRYIWQTLFKSFAA